MWHRQNRACANRWPAVCTLLALSALTTPVLAALEREGYLRAGAGTMLDGDRQACFELAGAATAYRLGNECEIYGELGLGAALYRFENAAMLRAFGMVRAFHPYDNRSPFAGDNGELVPIQWFVELEQAPGLSGGALWAGRRYYRRHDVHLVDFYYWNPSGLGAGVDEIGLGGERTLSYAYFVDDEPDQDDAARRHDLQLGGLTPNPGGTLALGLSYLQPAAGVDGAVSGWSLTVQHEQAAFLGGSNQLTLQYGRGPGIGLSRGGEPQAARERWRLRLMDAVEWQVGERLSGVLVVLFQQDRDPQNGDQRWYSAGVRPAYALRPPFKLLLELGQDRIEPERGATRQLSKVTLAPTWSRGPGVLDRPELRLFVTHARWNRAAQQAATAGDPLAVDGPFGPSRHGTTVGIQYETWW